MAIIGISMANRWLSDISAANEHERIMAKTWRASANGNIVLAQAAANVALLCTHAVCRHHKRVWLLWVLAHFTFIAPPLRFRYVLRRHRTFLRLPRISCAACCARWFAFHLVDNNTSSCRSLRALRAHRDNATRAAVYHGCDGFSTSCAYTA